jgi:1-deoxy-D-xylulose-5-phosphate synthase
MAAKRILDAIESPSALKLLTNEELAILAGEIREEIISVTSHTGGHVASSLGAVELILACHSLLDCPHDKLLFDVGHQAYAHKLLTGRLKQFETQRTYGGISGFPKPNESPYDVHPSGHASDSLSVALGLALARDLSGTYEKIVAIIGDASIAGGMAFEALNHIGQAQTPMVIILNDNEMSISKNVGALMKHFGAVRASASYKQARDEMQEMLENSGSAGQALVRFGRSAKDSLKQFFVPHSMVFEQLGITCTAPIDGHNIALLREILSVALSSDGPVLVHVVTKKGYGYKPAMDNPTKFHGVGAYDPKTGEFLKQKSNPSYMDVFGEALVREADKNENIVAITAAMKTGTGLVKFAEKYPERFVDVGIAEEHAVAFASGLAAGGKKPVVAIYSTFMQRAFDQIITDVALPNLDVVFCLDRAGLVGEDGPTHHGVFDIAYMRMIPNMKVLTPSDEAELASALHTALTLKGPVAIRYPRGAGEGAQVPEEPEALELGKARVLREGEDVALLAWGRMVSSALVAADLLANEGINARVVDMRWAKPVDEEAILQAAKTKLLVTIEEGVVKGGAGSAALEALSTRYIEAETLQLGIPDSFVGQGKVDLLFADLGLDGQGIAKSVKEALQL